MSYLQQLQCCMEREYRLGNTTIFVITDKFEFCKIAFINE